MKKRISAFTAMVIFIISTIIPGMAFANNNQVSNDNILISENNREGEMLFSNLFFNNNDDVEKIISHFDTNLSGDISMPSISSIDINALINKLQLDTNEEETICIIKNVCEIDEYVEKDKITEATIGIAPLDNIGGILGYNPNSIQPLWKSEVHNTDTTSIAKSYFSNEIAAKIGKANADVDVKYSSGWGAITNHANQYIHFNEYASGSEDSRDYAASTWFVASELAWKKGQSDNAYMYLGYALHPLQDKEAHGQIDRGKSIPAHTYLPGSNRHHADDKVGWEWTNSSRNDLKEVSGSRVRYNAAVAVTREWLAKYQNILK